MSITAVDTFTSTWSTGWTSFEPFLLGDQRHYLAYKSATGQITIDRVRADGSGVDTVFGDNWSLGWTSFVPFMLNGAPCSLEYKADTGQVSIDRFKPDLQGVDTLYGDTWSKGWTSFLPFVLGDQPHYLGYKVATGEVTIDRIKPDGSGVDTLYSATWSLGWTSFIPFMLNGQTHYIAYKTDTGEISIDRIRADGSGVDTVTSGAAGTWTTGWTTFVPFLSGGEAHYLGYKAGTGQVTIDKIRGDASGVDTVTSATWANDWTSIAGFTLGGNPSYLAYKSGSGDVAMGALRDPAAAAPAVFGPSRAPARSASLEGGRVFLDRLSAEGVDPIGGLDVAQIAARDEKFYQQLIAGNMPDFCRLWSEVAIDWTDPKGAAHTAKVRIMPDCLAVGSNDDWLRVTINGHTAQRLANAWGCFLPTSRVLSKAFLQSTTARLTAHPLAAYGNGAGTGDGKHQECNLAMRWAEDIIQGQIACAKTTPVPPEVMPQFNPNLGLHGSPPSCTLPAGHPPDQIVVGHKKEIVIPYVTGKLTFWGFYKGNDPLHPSFIQNNDTPHPTGFTDYAQGARLVHPLMEIDGVTVDYSAVLSDSVQYRAVADSMLAGTQIRYPEAP